MQSISGDNGQRSDALKVGDVVVAAEDVVRDVQPFAAIRATPLGPIFPTENAPYPLDALARVDKILLHRPCRARRPSSRRDRFRVTRTTS